MKNEQLVNTILFLLRVIMTIIFIFCLLSCKAQECDTIKYNYYQFCELDKNHQPINECVSMDVDTKFIIYEDSIIQINKNSTEVYTIENVNYTEIGVSYFVTNKDEQRLEIATYKDFPVITIYLQYSTPGLGQVVQRATYVNKH